MPSKKCFTLLELMLVIAIISVVAGINLPYFKNQLDKFRIEDFVRRLYLFFDHAKTYAVFYSLNTKIEIEDNKEITITKKQDEEFKPIEERFRRISLLKNMVIEAKDSEPVLFYPDGTCGEFSWDIVYRGKKLYTIKSLGFDGKFEIEKYKSR